MPTKEEFLRKNSINLSSKEEFEDNAPNPQTKSNKQKFLEKNSYQNIRSRNEETLGEFGKNKGKALLHGASQGLDFIANIFQGGSQDILPPGREPKYITAEGKVTNERPYNAIEAGFGEISGGFEPSDPLEKGLSKFANVALGSQAIPGAFGYNPMRLGSDLAFSTGSQLAEETGLGQGGQLGVGIGASLLPSILRTAISPRESAINLVTSLGRGFKPNGANIERQATNQGIQMAATDVLDNPMLQRMSRTVANKKSLGGEWMERIDRQFAQAVNREVNPNAIARQYTKEGAGARAANIAEETYQNMNRQLNRQYDTIKRADANFRASPQPLVNFIDTMEASLPPVTPETQGLHNRFNAIRNQIEETIPRAQFNPQTQLIQMVPIRQTRNMNLEELINLRSQLGDLARDVENVTGVRTLQRQFRPILQQSIAELEQSNPQLYERLNNLDNAKYQLNEETFGLDTLHRMMRAQTGEQAVNAIKNPEEYRAMANVLNLTPNGRNTLRDWNIAKVESILEPMFKDTSQGTFNHDKFLSLFQDSKKASWLNEAMTRETRRNLQELQNVSQYIKQGSSRLRQIAGKSHTSLDDTLALGAAVSTIFSGEPVSALMSMGSYLTPRLMAEAFTNPEFQRDLINAARQAEQNNIPRFERYMRNAMRRLNAPLIVTDQEIRKKHKDKDRKSH